MGFSIFKLVFSISEVSVQETKQEFIYVFVMGCLTYEAISAKGTKTNLRSNILGCGTINSFEKIISSSKSNTSISIILA